MTEDALTQVVVETQGLTFLANANVKSRLARRLSFKAEDQRVLKRTVVGLGAAYPLNRIVVDSVPPMAKSCE